MSKKEANQRLKQAREALAAKKEANKRLKQAREALAAKQERDIAAGIHEETPEYLRLNHAVAEAEKDVSWWRR